MFCYWYCEVRGSYIYSVYWFCFSTEMGDMKKNILIFKYFQSCLPFKQRKRWLSIVIENHKQFGFLEKNIYFFPKHLIRLASVSLKTVLWYGAVAVLLAHTDNLCAQVWAWNRRISVSVAPVPGAAALSSSLGGLGGSVWWPPSTVGSQLLRLGNLASTSASCIAKQYKFLLDLETSKVCRVQVIFIWD